MSRKGNCYDNSVMKTFFGRLKPEIYYGCETEYSSLNVFVVTIKSTSTITITTGVRKNKMDAKCKLWGAFMCLG